MEDTWKLEDIYINKEEWQKDIERIYSKLDEISDYQNKIKRGEDIYNCYYIYEKILEMFEKVYSYGMFKFHQNMADTNNIELFKKVEKISSDIEIKTAFIVPEISKIDEKELKGFLDSDPRLKSYETVINNIIEQKKHTLSENEEKIIASFSEVFKGSENTFDIFTNTEFKYPKIKDENGNMVEITDGTYSKYMGSSDQNVRMQAFDSMYSLYKKHINTITELYMTRVKEDCIISKLRKYQSSLEKAVINDDATLNVYNSLIEVVNKNIQINHKYISLKKKMLGLKEMHMYDIYVNKFKNNDEQIEYKDAQNIILKALEPLGKEYIEMLKVAFTNRWIDVYERENKRSGAYSSGVYGVHPFVLTNYTKTTRDVSTIAHELGHAMHSYYSNKTQNVINANYTIMVAEVASTVNEILLSEYLIKNEKDEIKKAALINERIDDIRATLIRQSMFAEFEKNVHEKNEKLESLTSEKLCNIYYDLNKKYFGQDIIIDENIKYEWARIPHFYSCFYVYKYATGISAAISIATKILNKEPGIVEKYINMLKQGSQKKSVELLKMVDVDLESTKPYEDAFKFYEDNINKLIDITYSK